MKSTSTFEFLAQWAMRKETQLATVRHMQGSPLRAKIQRETTIPRNADGTYRPTNNGNQTYGDPMERDATRRQPRFNISREQFQRRIQEQLCLKCAQPGHLARSCPKEDGSKPFNAQARSWQLTKKVAPWQSRPNITEIDVEKGVRTVGKQPIPPGRDGLRDRPGRKPIIMENHYAAPNYTETLEHDNDHIMVKIQLPSGKESIPINAMIDSVATEDFIDREVCHKHGIEMIKAKNPRAIYFADGKPSAMGPVTQMTKVPMDISSHRDLATFQVANLKNHEVILGMAWFREHNPTIDWNDKRITFNSELCMTCCLKSSPVSYAVPDGKALEVNLITRFSKLQVKTGPMASDQSDRVLQLTAEARVPTKGSARAAGHNLYANEATEVPAKGQAMVRRE